ncbi:MAG: sensor hybrid histidine kinase [Verrucomicrobiales bacterium]|jgi:CheY-like chemotaxis protein|nr:sensor hybrid histidine kinase [Verrucomicrobiales bacterium]
MERKFFIPPQEKTHEISGDALEEFKTILLLEDEGEMSDVLKLYLEESKYRVVQVRNGVEGLKKIIAQDFDVILCDMMMPNLPGDMFYLAVERTKPHLTRRFIFMTGHKGDKKIDDFIRRVKGIMLWKPFQPPDLLETIKSVIRKSQAVP